MKNNSLSYEELENIVKDVENVLRKYFQYNDKGYPNKDYDETFDAQSAIDEIHNVVGDI